MAALKIQLHKFQLVYTIATIFPRLHPWSKPEGLEVRLSKRPAMKSEAIFPGSGNTDRLLGILPYYKSKLPAINRKYMVNYSQLSTYIGLMVATIFQRLCIMFTKFSCASVILTLLLPDNDRCHCLTRYPDIGHRIEPKKTCVFFRASVPLSI